MLKESKIIGYQRMKLHRRSIFVLLLSEVKPYLVIKEILKTALLRKWAQKLYNKIMICRTVKANLGFSYQHLLKERRKILDRKD